MEPVTVHWWAILIAGVVNIILGAIWYSPFVFGKSWMQLMGKKGEMRPNPVTLLWMFILALVIAYILTHFVVYAGATTFWTGLTTGIWAALGFTVLTTASGTLASNTSWKLWAINAGYWLVALAIMGGVVAAAR